MGQLSLLGGRVALPVGPCQDRPVKQAVTSTG